MSNGDAWNRYCDVYRELFNGEPCLSPAAIIEFAGRERASVASSAVERCCYPEECAKLKRCIRPGDHDSPPPCRGNPYGTVASSATGPTYADIAGAVARGWCSPNNASKEMDSELAFAITVQVAALIGVSDSGGVQK